MRDYILGEALTDFTCACILMFAGTLFILTMLLVDI